MSRAPGSDDGSRSRAEGASERMAVGRDGALPQGYVQGSVRRPGPKPIWISLDVAFGGPPRPAGEDGNDDRSGGGDGPGALAGPSGLLTRGTPRGCCTAGSAAPISVPTWPLFLQALLREWPESGAGAAVRRGPGARGAAPLRPGPSGRSTQPARRRPRHRRPALSAGTTARPGARGGCSSRRARAYRPGRIGSGGAGNNGATSTARSFSLLNRARGRGVPYADGSGETCFACRAGAAHRILATRGG